MFRHDKRLQYYTPPESPDAHLAVACQELLGGHYGEVSVMMQYLMQGFTCKGAPKYRDMLLEIGTEEIGHVEMLSTLITQLMAKAPLEEKDAMAKSNPLVGAIMGGKNSSEATLELAAMMPSMAIVAGGGPRVSDSSGSPWSGAFVIASGNLLADFRDNLAKESQGRLQACRVYNMTDDRGVKDTLAFMIERDYEHQLHWLAAVRELESLEEPGVVVPVEVGHFEGKERFAYDFWGLSNGTDAATGAWADGPAPDDSGNAFRYLKEPEALGPVPEFAPGDPRLFGTQKRPKKPADGKTTEVDGALPAKA